MLCHGRVMAETMTIAKNGIVCLDNFSARGRKPVEDKLPNLLGDIKEMAENSSQTDPTFKTTRLYIRLSASLS